MLNTRPPQPSPKRSVKRSKTISFAPSHDENQDHKDHQNFAKLVADIVAARLEAVIKDALLMCKSPGSTLNSGLVIEMDKLLEESPPIEKHKSPNMTKYKRRPPQAEANRPMEPSRYASAPGASSAPGVTSPAASSAPGVALAGSPKEPTPAGLSPSVCNIDCSNTPQEQLDWSATAQADCADGKLISKEKVQTNGDKARSTVHDMPPMMHGKHEEMMRAIRSEPVLAEKQTCQTPSSRKSSPTKVAEETDEMPRQVSAMTDGESPNAKERTWPWNYYTPRRASATPQGEHSYSSSYDSRLDDPHEGEESNSPSGKSRESRNSWASPGDEGELALQPTPSLMMSGRNMKKAQTVKSIAGVMASALFETEELTFTSCKSCPLSAQDSTSSPRSPKKNKSRWWPDKRDSNKKVAPEVVGTPQWPGGVPLPEQLKRSSSDPSKPAKSPSAHELARTPTADDHLADFSSLNLDINMKEDDRDSNSGGEYPEESFGVRESNRSRYSVSNCSTERFDGEDEATSKVIYHSCPATGSRIAAPQLSLASSRTMPLGGACSVNRRISCSVESLRQQRDEHLMEMYHIDSGASEEGKIPLHLSEYQGNMSMWSVIMLRICGIIPWCESEYRDPDVETPACLQAILNFFRNLAWYKVMILVVSALSLIICLEQVVTAQAAADEADDDDLASQLGLLSDVPIAVGCILGLLCTGSLLQRKGFESTYSLLVSYGQREGLLDQWARVSRRDLVATLIVWACAVAERIRNSDVLSSPDRRHVLDLLVFIFTSLLLMGLAFCVLHVCSLLTSMVDAYCVHFVSNPKLNEAVRHWNIIQAMLREACAAIEYCFIVLQTVALASVLLSVADTMINTNRGAETGAHLLTLLPGALITLGVARIFYCAAEVTEKCARVPTLINGLFFGSDIDVERQYVVEYIINSAAGFYVFEVRLTSAMALKFAYLSGVAAFFVATKVLSRSW